RGPGNADSRVGYHAEGAGLAAGRRYERTSLAAGCEFIVFQSSHAERSEPDLQRRPSGDHSTGPDLQLLPSVSGHDPACGLPWRAECTIEKDAGVITPGVAFVLRARENHTSGAAILPSSQVQQDRPAFGARMHSHPSALTFLYAAGGPLMIDKFQILQLFVTRAGQFQHGAFNTIFLELSIAELARVGVSLQRPTTLNLFSRRREMRPSPRFPFLFAAMIVILGLAVSGYGQQQSGDREAYAAVANGQAGYDFRVTPVDVNSAPGQIGSSTIIDLTTGAVLNAGGNSGLNTAAGIGGGNDDNLVDGDIRHTPPGGTIDGLDTLATFNGAFNAQAGPSQGRDFLFTMMGNHPLAGGTTVIPARIDEVSLQLLNADGTTFKTVSFDPFHKLTLESPNFERLDYRSGRHIEFADAVHRAQFFNRMDKDWHTVLVPHVVNKVTVVVPRL